MNKKEEQAIKSLICGGLQAIQMGVEDALRSGINCKMPDAVVFKVWMENNEIEFVVPLMSPDLGRKLFERTMTYSFDPAIETKEAAKVAGTA